ncbi:signal peptidase complex subunit [Martiniozyma asiatica (nom. inval.)]|nr:signal peptidase complex subunit [Martiniozyma asiatica]
MSFQKVSLYSSAALRTEADAHLHEVFESLGYSESFIFADVKLFLGYLSVAFAGLMYWAEKHYGNNFTNSEYYSITRNLVYSYFIVQLILWVFDKFVTGNAKFVGTKNTGKNFGKGKQITITTWTDESDVNESGGKTEPDYVLLVDLDGKEKEFKCKFSQIFFDDGYLSLDAFKSFIGEFMKGLEKSE